MRDIITCVCLSVRREQSTVIAGVDRDLPDQTGCESNRAVKYSAFKSTSNMQLQITANAQRSMEAGMNIEEYEVTADTKRDD